MDFRIACHFGFNSVFRINSSIPDNSHPLIRQSTSRWLLHRAWLKPAARTSIGCLLILIKKESTVQKTLHISVELRNACPFVVRALTSM